MNRTDALTSTPSTAKTQNPSDVPQHPANKTVAQMTNKNVKILQDDPQTAFILRNLNLSSKHMLIRHDQPKNIYSTSAHNHSKCAACK